MTIEKKLEEYRSQLTPRLEVFFDQKIKHAREIAPETVSLFKEAKDFINRGGKRIRPALVYWGYQAAAGKGHQKEVIDFSLCFEFIHGFALVHDDIIDESAQRRGAPTLHLAYQKISSSPHQGLSQAIVMGDLFLFWAYEIASQINFVTAEKKIEILRRLNQVVLATELGELKDITLEKQSAVSEKEIIDVLRLKTAQYTFEGPLQIGALLAGASPEKLKALGSFGLYTGLAFQIQDDILGVFGDQKTIGKPILSDIAQGKMTLLVQKALQNTSSNQKKFIQKQLGNKKIGLNNFKKVQEIIVQTKALDYCQELAYKLITQAHRAVAQSKLERKDDLINLAQFIAHRAY